MTLAGWSALLAAAQAPERALRAALADPRASQARWLAAHLAANAESRFGRDHGFAAIRSIADYRAAVPIAPYDAFRPAIAAMAAGAASELVVDPVIAFEQTGGTASGGKLVPYTASSLTSFSAAVLPWLADLARRRPAITQGRAYVSISPATRQPAVTAGGIAIGLPEAAYLGADLARALGSILAVPPDVGAIAEIPEWRLATLAALVEADDLAFVSVWSPTFLLDLIEALPSHAEAVAVRLTPPARQRLARALAGPVIDTARLWPDLAAISCWSDASSAPFAARLAALCPQAAIEPKGLLATEAAITLPHGSAPGSIPALTSGFLEFVDDAGAARLVDELEAGATYRVVVTTPAGFYRYDIGDRLACLGHVGAVPRLAFVGRAGLVSDMVGEKLDDAFVGTVLRRLPVPAALVARALPRPHYRLWLDAGAECDADAAARAVEAGLRANPQYAYARDLGQLGPLAREPRPGFAAARAAIRAGAGIRLADVKPQALIVEHMRDPPGT
ncbi:MAG: GH3 auxin-responsive promoter family protein [Hyphomicrobiaceae bacterium]|nr:GH3 auxin-responsive promoter family protein [Hyphomicrobiaceae bacterium]